jgi:hypothetical protein
LKHQNKAIFSQFLRTDHQNPVREYFFKHFLDILWIKNMFKPIRAINRINSRVIWTRICEDIYHFERVAHPPPKKKFPSGENRFCFDVNSEKSGFPIVLKIT